MKVVFSPRDLPLRSGLLWKWHAPREPRMTQGTQLRKLLPLIQTAIALVFGGLGQWMREYDLNHTWAGWNSTQVYHVWPWPLKFAAILNMPAYLAGLLFSWPIDTVWPNLPEHVLFAPILLFVPLLWYWTGSWLDRRFGTVTRTGQLINGAHVWLLLFVLASAAGASIPVGSHVGPASFLSYGIITWVIICALMAASEVYRKLSSRPG
jgi:hypothetical protein